MSSWRKTAIFIYFFYIFLWWIIGCINGLLYEAWREDCSWSLDAYNVFSITSEDSIQNLSHKNEKLVVDAPGNFLSPFGVAESQLKPNPYFKTCDVARMRFYSPQAVRDLYIIYTGVDQICISNEAK